MVEAQLLYYSFASSGCSASHALERILATALGRYVANSAGAMPTLRFDAWKSDWLHRHDRQVGQPMMCPADCQVITVSEHLDRFLVNDVHFGTVGCVPLNRTGDEFIQSRKNLPELR